MSVTKLIRIKNNKKVTQYRAQVYIRGMRLDDRIFDTKASAHSWHDQRKVILTNDPRANAEDSRMLFSDCLDKFEEYARSNVRAQTLQVYQTRLPYLRNSLLAKVRVTEINSKTVDLWLEELLEHPTAKTPCRKSFGKEIELLSTVFNWYRDNKNEAFVVPLTSRHREKAKYKDIAPRRQDYFIRPEETRNWIDWLKEHRKPVYWQLATFLVLTGCRVGEACALKWDAIDFETKIARVLRTIYWDHHTKQPILTDTTKTQGSNRIIALPEELISMLLEMKSKSGDSEWIFPSKQGLALKYNAIQSAFNAGFLALGLPWRSTHICRHTFATISLMATDSLSGVQASLGHTKQSMTEKYAKVVAMLQTGNAEKTASLFGLNRNHTQITHVDFRQRKRP